MLGEENVNTSESWMCQSDKSDFTNANKNLVSNEQLIWLMFVQSDTDSLSAICTVGNKIHGTSTNISRLFQNMFLNI